MAVSEILYFLALATCLALCYAQNSCTDNNFRMAKEIPSKDEFERKFHRTYRSVNISRLECAQSCYDDKRCNGMLVCQDVCHRFGVFAIIPTSVHAPNYNNCDVHIMNRCKNNGEPDQSGYCRCPRGYGGPFCQTVVKDSCYRQWQLLHDTAGNGDLDVLLHVSNTVCGIKLKHVTSKGVVHTVDSVGVTSGNVWAQSVYQLSKYSWDTFEAIPLRQFRTVINALYETVISFNMGGSLIGSFTAEIPAKWYVKKISELRPYFENDASGAVVLGDLDSLVAKIKAGSSLCPRKTVFMTEDSQQISASDITHVGLSFLSGYASFGAKPYWFLTRSTNTGWLYILRWNIGVGTQNSKKTVASSSSWCIDDCWVKILASDRFGEETHGSANGLARALLSGHKVRLYAIGIAANIKAVYIHGQIVSASLEDMMEPIGVTDFDSLGIAISVLASSSGHTQYRAYTFETNSIKQSEPQTATELNWFVDTREWTQALSLTGDGHILSGSVTDLRQKVLVGASVRIVLDFTSGLSVIVDADHLEVSFEGYVAAEVIYHVNVEFGEGNIITFAPESFYHYWSAIITTEGTFKKYYYMYKNVTGVHQTVLDIYRYTWFVQE